MPTPPHPIAEEDARGFPATAWTVLLTARDPAAPAAREAIEVLCRSYWPPVFHYLRALGLGAEAAEDLAQSVLADFCTRLDELDRSRGRLRHFLKAATRHALYNHRRDAGAAKRGNGEAPLTLDSLAESAQPAAEAAGDAAFDQPWAWTLFDRALAGLAESYARRGKGELFEVLKPGLISDDGLRPYAEIGSAFGVGEPQIKNEVHRLRRRFAERLRGEVAATLGPSAAPAEIEEETRYLVQALAHER